MFNKNKMKKIFINILELLMVTINKIVIKKSTKLIIIIFKIT